MKTPYREPAEAAEEVFIQTRTIRAKWLTIGVIGTTLIIGASWGESKRPRVTVSPEPEPQCFEHAMQYSGGCGPDLNLCEYGGHIQSGGGGTILCQCPAQWADGGAK